MPFFYAAISVFLYHTYTYEIEKRFKIKSSKATAQTAAIKRLGVFLCILPSPIPVQYSNY